MVNGAGDQFFASAAFAGDEHGRIRGTDSLNGIEYPLHCDTLPNDVFRTRDLGHSFAQANVFLFSTLVRQGFLDKVCNLVRIEWLCHVIISTVFQRSHSRIYRGVAGHHDDNQVGIEFMDAALQLDSIGAPHFDVDEGHVPALFGEAGQRPIRILSSADLVAFFMEPFA